MILPQPEKNPPRLRDGECPVATNMRCNRCRKRLDTNTECNCGLCRQCDGLEDD